MLPLFPPRKTSVGPAPEKVQAPTQEAESDGMDLVAADIMRAIESKSTDQLAEALRSYRDICEGMESMPEENEG